VSGIFRDENGNGESASGTNALLSPSCALRGGIESSSHENKYLEQIFPSFETRTVAC